MVARTPDGKCQTSHSEPIPSDVSRIRNLYSRMKLTPWREIWESLFTGRIRPYEEATEMLVNSMVEDAFLDDPEVLSRTETYLSKL